MRFFICIALWIFASHTWMTIKASVIDESLKFSNNLAEILARNRSMPLRHEIPVITVQPRDPSVLQGLRNVVYSMGLAQTEENIEIARWQWTTEKRVQCSKEMKPYRQKATEHVLRNFSRGGQPPDEATKEEEKQLECDMNRIYPPELSQYSNIDHAVDHFALKALKATKLKWEYVGSAGIDDVAHDLASGTVANAMFIFHADPSGQMYDSMLRKFHGTFFKIIRPTLRSLAFFVCHGDEIIGNYHLNEADSLSFYDKRLVFIVPWSQKHNPTAQAENRGLPKFISMVDAQLAAEEELQVFGTRTEQPANARCLLKITKFQTGGDVFQIRLNKRLIGATKLSEDALPFDCALLKNRMNGRIVIQIDNPQMDFKFLGLVPLSEQNLTISLEYQGVTLLQPTKANNFERADSSPKLYAASKIRFNIEDAILETLK